MAQQVAPTVQTAKNDTVRLPGTPRINILVKARVCLHELV